MGLVMVDSAAVVVVAVGVDPGLRIGIRADSASEAVLLFVTGPATAAASAPPAVSLAPRALSPFLHLPLLHFRLPADWPAVDRNS